MSSLAALVSAHGPLKKGDGTAEKPDDTVLAAQVALVAAGYRVGQDGVYGPRTEMVVRQFQQQHRMRVDGVLGPLTAAVLDAPHDALIKTAIPLVHSSGSPHDDTASLVAFYGDPRPGFERWKAQNVITVPCPWQLFYEGNPWHHPIPFHRKAAEPLANAMARIWDAAGKRDESPILKHVRNFSGSGNFRPVRGSSRLSCHAFWAAIDFDAEHLPLGHRVSAATMPQEIVDAFEGAGFFWGGRFKGRPDPMHVQYAHE